MLTAVHDRNLRHGDVTPWNILYDPEQDAVVLADFGLSLRVGRAGTPGYVAPEVVEGPVGPAADVFGLAATLYHLLTGKAPFPTGSLAASAAAVSRGMPPVTVDAPPEVLAILEAAPEADPSRRIGLVAFRNRLRAATATWLGPRFGDVVQYLPPVVRLDAVLMIVAATG